MTYINGVDQQATKTFLEDVDGTEIIVKNAHINVNNVTTNLNVFKVTGSILVISQYAEIMEVTDTSNMTAVYADLWDGTNSVVLTKNTADFSGMTVGSIFMKDKISTSEYTLNNADECRMAESTFRQVGYPFLVTAKSGADTYIRFNFTTNTTLNFKMDVYFRYKCIDGGCIELA